MEGFGGIEVGETGEDELRVVGQQLLTTRRGRFEDGQVRSFLAMPLLAAFASTAICSLLTQAEGQACQRIPRTKVLPSAPIIMTAVLCALSRVEQ